MHNFPDYKERGIRIGAMGASTIAAVKDAGLDLDITTSAAAPSMAAAIDLFLRENGQPVLQSQEDDAAADAG